jgi:acetyl-CoA acetyltransferase family protein
VPVVFPQRKGDPIVFDTDEHPRIKKTADGYALDTSAETLAKLKPAFRAGGHGDGRQFASGLNDGAAALLLTSAKRAAALGLRPLARWVASAAAGVDPRTMGLGPVPATRKVLARAGLTRGADLDLVELNEAFAVQSLAVMRELGLSPEMVNVNGGAIALGHPLGCSGARILTTLLHEMKRRPRRRRGRCATAWPHSASASARARRLSSNSFKRLTPRTPREQRTLRRIFLFFASFTPLA